MIALEIITMIFYVLFSTQSKNKRLGENYIHGKLQRCKGHSHVVEDSNILTHSTLNDLEIVMHFKIAKIGNQRAV